MEKKVIVILVVVLCCSVPSFGLSFMGAPKAGLSQGQCRIGLDYSHSEMDLEFSASGVPSETLEVETDMLFANLGYGLADTWEGFVRLGVASIEIDEFDGGGEFAYGFGTKATFIEQDAVSWGGLFQINWFEGDDSIDGVDVDIDVYEIQIAIGPTYEAENIRIYGGPFLHLFDGDGKIEAVLPFFGLINADFDIEQESEIGGYVGTQIDIAENSNVNIEFQFTGDAWAVGAGIGLRY